MSLGLRSLLGLFSHYARFLPAKYYELIWPIRKLTRKDMPCLWEKEQKICLQKIKMQIV